MSNLDTEFSTHNGFNNEKMESSAFSASQTNVRFPINLFKFKLKIIRFSFIFANSNFRIAGTAVAKRRKRAVAVI